MDNSERKLKETIILLVWIGLFALLISLYFSSRSNPNVREIKYSTDIVTKYDLVNVRVVSKNEIKLEDNNGFLSSDLKFTSTENTYLEFYYKEGSNINKEVVLDSEVQITEHNGNEIKLEYILTEKTSYDCYDGLSDSECSTAHLEYKKSGLLSRLFNPSKKVGIAFTESYGRYVLYVPKGFSLNQLYECLDVD